MKTETKFKFNTAIITYPSDYDGLLSIGLICDKFEEVKTGNTKIVVAREDPDENIQRVHFHCYWDDEKQKNVTSKYFEIKLPEPVVVFIHEDKTREYVIYSSIASQLGIDNIDEMPAAIDNYVKNCIGKEQSVVSWQYLEYAHPNIETKKVYGDKYFMLRYVVKQKLVARSNFDVAEELKFLEEQQIELMKKANELIEQQVMQEIGVTTVSELIELLKKYAKKLENKKKRTGEKRKYNKKSKEQINHERAFCELIRNIFYENPGITKAEVMDIVNNDTNYYFVYASKYLNYSKLISDSFKNKPKNKINRDYNLKYWVPNKLYDYLMWLDKWVENWTTGREQCERRPKGLILIGASRTGKSSLMSLLGDYVYFKNIWSSDNWEYLPPYTIMDDMDAADEGKGLSFSWFKPWFGAQDSITITDKYRPKEDISNGKPLIWLNNFDINETFKSETALDYIRRNMVYVNIGNRNLFTKPEGMDIYQYKEFDPKTTWYYRNVVHPKEVQKQQEMNSTPQLQKRELECAEDTFNQEKGRPPKRIRNEDTSESSMVE